MNFDAESLQNNIPSYLTAEDQRALVAELQAIAAGEHSGYFLSEYFDDFQEQMLQGDGWRGFQLYIHDKAEVRSIKGLVLSNSCDVDPGNPRPVPANVTFAPLVKLSAYQEVLAKSGIESAQITSKIDAIKAQKTTNIFYIPSGGPLDDDYIVRLDSMQSMPVHVHNQAQEKEKLFTLSQTGFYMLILKLSVHFCRLHERINRNAPPATSSI